MGWALEECEYNIRQIDLCDFKKIQVEHSNIYYIYIYQVYWYTWKHSGILVVWIVSCLEYKDNKWI